jgi:hypothetical protein
VVPAFRGRTELRLSRQHRARSGRKDFLPVEPQGGLSFLFRLSGTQVRLKSLLVLSGSRQIHSEPADVLRGKSADFGLNGRRPTLRVGALHLYAQKLDPLFVMMPCLFAYGDENQCKQVSGGILTNFLTESGTVNFPNDRVLANDIGWSRGHPRF